MYRIHLRATVFAVAVVLAVFDLLAAEESIPALRYGCAAGKQYAFEVKIQAEAENYDEVREGVLTYTVTTAKDNEFVLKPREIGCRL